jgi:hypothetical protein
MMNFEEIHNALASQVKTAGRFKSVQKHEPRSAPAENLSAAVWCDNVRPASKSSGLASTAALLNFKIRIMLNITGKPEDKQESLIWDAYDLLMEDYAAHFTLDGLCKAINLQGADGSSLQGQGGYLSIDTKLYRIVDFTLPLTVSDAWDQEA